MAVSPFISNYEAAQVDVYRMILFISTSLIESFAYFYLVLFMDQVALIPGCNQEA